MFHKTQFQRRSWDADRAPRLEANVRRRGVMNNRRVSHKQKGEWLITDLLRRA